ncbi:MAG: hypothetical protein WCO24_01905, partial [Actinomycetes bacterium]
LSQRKTSLLIAEDSRGVGQVQAMGGISLSARDEPETAAAALDELFATRGAAVAKSVNTMRTTHEEMLRFIKQL